MSPNPVSQRESYSIYPSLGQTHRRPIGLRRICPGGTFDDRIYFWLFQRFFPTLPSCTILRSKSIMQTFLQKLLQSTQVAHPNSNWFLICTKSAFTPTQRFTKIAILPIGFSRSKNVFAQTDLLQLSPFLILQFQYTSIPTHSYFYIKPWAWYGVYYKTFSPPPELTLTTLIAE